MPNGEIRRIKLCVMQLCWTKDIKIDLSVSLLKILGNALATNRNLDPLQLPVTLPQKVKAAEW